MLRRTLIILLLCGSGLGLATCGGSPPPEPATAPGTASSDAATSADAEPTSEEATTQEATTEEATTAAETVEGGGASAGAEVFSTAGCGSCHALAAADTDGTIGPNLDEERPSFDKVVERVTEGQGVMPSFADILTEAQIRDVAAFVSESTRGADDD